MPWPVLFAFPVLTLLTAESALAQREERRGFIGFGVGPAAPFGSFAEASSISEGTGRASPGYTSTFLNLGYRFRQRLGVAVALSYSQYTLRDGGDDDWWEAAALMLGPMYTHRLGDRTAVDLKAMFGTIAMTPVVDSYTTHLTTGGGFGVDMRVAFRYDVLRRWAVFAEGGLQASRASFDSGIRKDYRALISGFGVAFRPKW